MSSPASRHSFSVTSSLSPVMILMSTPMAWRSLRTFFDAFLRRVENEMKPTNSSADSSFVVYFSFGFAMCLIAIARSGGPLNSGRVLFFGARPRVRVKRLIRPVDRDRGASRPDFFRRAFRDELVPVGPFDRNAHHLPLEVERDFLRFS